MATIGQPRNCHTPANLRCRCGAEKDKQWHLLCNDCWAKLPKLLRDELYSSSKGKEGNERHRITVRECIAFLRRLEGRRGDSASDRERRNSPNDAPSESAGRKETL